MKIRKLSTVVANQIAAGEVIERPASIVKELLENASDAKANKIVIALDYGGLNLVRVIDNGNGISKEDLPLSIAPHATSKISDITDLNSIQTMGFRGEALASIASISKFIIISKPDGQSHAMKLSLDRDNHLSVIPAARNTGTTVEVRDIFYNVPVRKKFLKTAKIEFQAIESLVKRFALCAFECDITLIHNDKEVFRLPPAQDDKAIQARIQKILGKPFLSNASKINLEHEDIKLEGWISDKHYQISQNNKQWIYVNGRMVKDKLLQHAIKQGYEAWLNPGRHPVCLLFLTISPKCVDVNVHPTKHEVRFHDPRLVHDLLSSIIQHTLSQDTSSLTLHSDSEEKILHLDEEIHAVYLSLEKENFIQNSGETPNPCVFETKERFDWVDNQDKEALSCSVALNMADMTGSEAVYHPVNPQDRKNTQQYHLDWNEDKFEPNPIQKNTQRTSIPGMLSESTSDLSASAIKKDTTDKWVLLENTYAIFFLKETYLVDLIKLYRLYLEEKIYQQHPLALPRRRLLVPISYRFKNLSDTHFFENESETFACLGISYNWVSEKEILLREIPQLTPFLDIHRFLNLVVESPLCKKEASLDSTYCLSELINILLLAQDFNPAAAPPSLFEAFCEQILGADEEMLSPHNKDCYEKRHNNKEKPNWIKVLSKTFCEALFNA